MVWRSLGKVGFGQFSGLMEIGDQTERSAISLKPKPMIKDTIFGGEAKK